MKKSVSAPLAVGVPCLILGFILAFSFGHPNGIQYLFIRGLFALGIIGTGVSILVGTAHLTWTVGKSLVVTAGGSCALFVLLYYYNPPPPPDPESTSPAVETAPHP